MFGLGRRVGLLGPGISGPQGQRLSRKLDHLPADVDNVFIVLHRPPYTSSSDMKMFGGGHSALSPEKEPAKTLEARQQNLHARIIVFSGHVHHYERHEHGGITYFVTGGAGAHAYPIERAKDDPFQGKEVNCHYLMVEVDRSSLKIAMHRLDLTSGRVSGRSLTRSRSLCRRRRPRHKPIKAWRRGANLVGV